jgi:hypothetical protein
MWNNDLSVFILVFLGKLQLVRTGHYRLNFQPVFCFLTQGRSHCKKLWLSVVIYSFFVNSVDQPI